MTASPESMVELVIPTISRAGGVFDVDPAPGMARFTLDGKDFILAVVEADGIDSIAILANAEFVPDEEDDALPTEAELLERFGPAQAAEFEGSQE